MTTGNFWSRLGEVNARSGGLDLVPGVYDLVVAKIASGINQTKKEYFVIEFDVETSSEPSRPAGTRVSWMATNQGYADTFFSNVKGALLAVCQAKFGKEQVNEAAINDAIFEQAVGIAQPFTGVRVRAQAANTVTKAGKDFTIVTFSPIGPALAAGAPAIAIAAAPAQAPAPAIAAQAQAPLASQLPSFFR